MASGSESLLSINDLKKFKKKTVTQDNGSRSGYLRIDSKPLVQNIYKKISRANYQLMDRAIKIATCGKVWLIKNDSLMYAD